MSSQPDDYHVQHGKVELFNDHIAGMDVDVLYHIGLNNKTHNLKEMFSDVKFVVFGGSTTRMKTFANFLIDELSITLPAGTKLENIAHESDRYVLYKTGPVLSVSHGMGIPSLSIILHEMLKLVHHAGCEDITFLRMGTSGGVGVPGGTVVITEEAVDGLFQPYMELAVLGRKIRMPARLDSVLAQELKSLASETGEYETIIGKTMCAEGFYEAQGRLDGAFCSYNKEDKLAFLHQVHDQGVRNIEMESLCFAAYCYRAKISGAVICAVLVDRLHGDQITTPHDVMDSWSKRPQKLIVELVRKRLGLTEK